MPLARIVDLARLLIEDKEDATSVPFLRGILTRSLQQAGLSFQQAYALADEVREELGDDRTLSKLELHRTVYKRLKKSFGEKTADRYLRPSGITPPVQVEDLDGRLSPFSGELLGPLISHFLSPRGSSISQSRKNADACFING